ncbi:RloB family protein [Vibrio diabolicus]|uniref:RloB family protein n=1 Tax=Vibrio diabolicus TaxID=50719 RepID=UPI0015F6D450|nr:RloB family protein [Vibrio diabolicus]
MSRLLKRNRERTSRVVTSKKIIIAPEGVSTEVDYFSGIQQYFEGLKERVSKRYEQLIEFVVIERGIIEQNEEDKDFAIGSSSPRFVASYVRTYVSESGIDIEADDYVYVLVDKDQWTNANLSEAQQICKSNNYCFIVSNPSFELWLYLHFVDVSSLGSDELERILSNKTEVGKVSYLKLKIKEQVSGFNFNNLNIDDFKDHIKIALKHADKLSHPEEGWCDDEVGTQISRIFTDTKLLEQIETIL